MADSVSTEAWLDQRRWAALEEALKAQGSNVKRHLQDYLITLYNETVPLERWVQIETAITKEELESAQAAEDQKVYAAFHIRENGHDSIFSTGNGEEFLDVAIRLRRYLQGDAEAVKGGFSHHFYKTQPITRERFDELAALRLENTGKVSGAFEIDLDAGWCSALNLADGWQTFKNKDVSTAAYHANRTRNLQRNEQWRRLVDYLYGRNIELQTFLSHYYTLDGIKSKTVGDGQHGTARWATKQEIRQTYAHVPFEPELWRKGEHLPEKQGLVLGCEGPKDHVTALVDTDDIHAMVTAASGAGKTAFFLYPNIEYALASGMSFLCTDTKGDLFRNYAGIAKDCYGYQIAVLDLRNPTRSDGNNLLHLINKYMDIYKADPKNLAAKAKAEKYSKILAKTLINTSGGDSAQYGQNAFFYDSAEGLLTAMFLLVAEYLPTEDADGNPIEKRHIVSVFKLVQELLAPSRVKGKNQFQLLLEKLPPNHKARWFAGSALNTAEQAMASVISTVLSRLNAFLDSEMEQILCFDTAIDAEKFCNEKSAIFIVLPEEDQTKYFMVSLILQNLYREILTVADENGGRLKNRVVFFADELGTCPPIQSLELMFSASRSRGLMLVPIVQSITGQLQKNYGKEGSEIIVDNCQVNLYGGFAPASQTAVELSKSLGSRTVMSGSISRGKNDPSQSLQMMERPLMTPDELKSMPKGSFIVAKTGVHPMKVKLRLFLDWGIRFGMPYEVPEKAQRFVAYADKQELEESIIRRHYGTIVMDSEQPQGGGTSAGGMAQGIQAAPDSRKTVFRP